MPVKEYVVLSGGLVARQGKDGSQSQRFERGDKVKLNSDHTDIDRLVTLKAIAASDDEDARPSSTWVQAQAANVANQNTRAQRVDFGAVSQSEDDLIRAQLEQAGGDDDGGKGSSPVPPPGAPGSTPPVPPGGAPDLNK